MNSFGGTTAGQRLMAQQTGAPGNNPFARQQQQQQQGGDQPFFSI
jgi:epsin